MRFLFSSLVLVSALAATAPAFGQALSAQDEAQQRFQTGLKYYDARDFESARLAFTQAYAVIQKPSILQNLAFSELYSNHPLDAVTHFEQYLKDASVPQDKKTGARRGLEEAMKKTGHYAVKMAPEASLTVDGKVSAMQPPALVHVTAGSHVLEAKAGIRSKAQTVDARAGETTNVDLGFDGATPVAAAPPPPVGTIPPPVTEPPHEPTVHESFWGWRSIGGLALVVAGGVFIGVSFAAKSSESSDEDKINSLNAMRPAGASGCANNTSAACAELPGAIKSRDDDSSKVVTFRAIGIPVVVVGAGLVVSAIIKPHRYETSKIGFLEHLTPITGPRQAGLLFTSDF